MGKKSFAKSGGIIKTWRDPYGVGFSTTRAKEIKFEPGLTVLVGCNGIGKTTLISNINHYCEQNNIPCYLYDNFKNGAESWQSILASPSEESESARMKMRKLADAIKKDITNQKMPAEEVWLLFDETDNWLSLDNVIELKKNLYYALSENLKDRDVYIIISTNEYEMANGEACLNVVSGKYVKFNGYNDYRRFILKTREIKDARAKKAATEK